MTAVRAPDAPIAGAAWVAASVVVPNLFVVVLSVAIDGTLGAEGLGRQSVIAFVSGTATILAGAGGFVVVVRSVAAALADDDGAAARRAARWGARVHLITGVAAGAVVALPAWWVPRERVAWLLAALVTVLSTSQTVRVAVLVGARRWRDANLAGLAIGAVGVPASIAVLRLGGAIEGLFAVEAAMVGVNLVWMSVLARRALAGSADRVDEGRRFDGASQRRFAVLSTAGVAVTVVIWRRSEILLLSFFSTDAEVAHYSVAFAVSAILLSLSDRFSTALLSTFSSLVASADPARLRVVRERTLRLLMAAMLPLVGCAAGLGPFTIRLLYGDDYSRSGPVLLLMLGALAGMPLWAVSSAVLAAHGDAASPLVAGLAAVVVDVGLALALIPGHGALGAAAASAAAQVTAIAVLQARTSQRAGPVSWDIGSMMRSLVVAGAVGSAAWSAAELLSGPLGLAVGGLTAPVVLMAVVRFARPLTGADATWVAQNLHGSVGRRAAGLAWSAARPPAGGDHSERAEPATSA